MVGAPKKLPLKETWFLTAAAAVAVELTAEEDPPELMPAASEEAPGQEEKAKGIGPGPLALCPGPDPKDNFLTVVLFERAIQKDGS